MDPNHVKARWLLAGPSGSGKTTLARAIVAGWKACARFIFDPEGEWSRILHAPECRDTDALAKATAAGRPACFEPSLLFRSNAKAWEWFCTWSFNASTLFHGTKLLVADEVQSYTPDGKLPAALVEVLDRSRRYELDSLFIAHTPAVHRDIRKQLTRLIAFRFEDPRQLEWLESFGIPPAAVQALPPYGFISRDFHTGELRAHAPVDRSTA